MIGAARSVWISFRRGGGFPFFLLVLFLIALAFSAALRVEGSFLVNGKPLALDEESRTRFALGFGLRMFNFFLVCFLLFRGHALLLSEIERGSAAFDLTAPVSRTGYIAGRGIGLIAILVLLWAAAVVLFEALLFWRFGLFSAGLLPGALVFLLGQIVLVGLLLFFRLFIGGGWGAMTALAVLVGSWFLSLDMVESYLFDVPVPEEGGGWWVSLLLPYLGGEPAGAGAAMLRFLSRVFPPVANVQSVGLDLALGQPVFPAFDRWSIPLAAAWSVLLFAASFRIFRKKDW